MYLSETHKFIFIHNPKSGGTSIEFYLKAHSDPKFFLHAHAYATDAIAQLGREAWDRYYTFGFVRNPWARLVSWYSMIRERPRRLNHLFGDYIRAHSSNFEEFLTNCTDTIAVTSRAGFVCHRNLFKNQVDFFTDDAGKIAVTFIGRFENFQSDFKQVQKALGLPVGDLPKTNITKPKDYRTFYSNGTREYVAEKFQKDIAYFGYTFDDGAG